MSLLYDPDKILSKIANDKRLSSLLTSNISINRKVLAFTKAFDFLDSKVIEEIALKTINEYKKMIDAAKDSSKKKKEISSNPKLLKSRLKSVILFQTSKKIKEDFFGQFYEWLPSSANEPDPLHQLKYGRIYQVGVGEMPNERYGCQCGMRILTNEEARQKGVV